MQITLTSTIEFEMNTSKLISFLCNNKHDVCLFTLQQLNEGIDPMEFETTLQCVDYIVQNSNPSGYYVTLDCMRNGNIVINEKNETLTELGKRLLQQ